MLEYKNLGTPDEVMTFPKGRVEIVHLAGLTLGRGTLEPGWKWSQDVKSIAQTESCELTHSAVVLSGRMHVVMDDGTEIELGPGDAHVVGPGHDGWIVGDEPCVVIDVLDYKSPTAAAASGEGVPSATCPPCGVTFSIAPPHSIDHLVDAIQQHARDAHGHEATREHILAELTSEPALAAKS